jgi:hypothetical protein
LRNSSFIKTSSSIDIDLQHHGYTFFDSCSARWVGPTRRELWPEARRRHGCGHDDGSHLRHSQNVGESWNHQIHGMGRSIYSSSNGTSPIVIRVRRAARGSRNILTNAAIQTVSLICFGLVVPQAYYGAGRHAYHIPPAKESQGLYINFISQPFFLVGVMLVKVSIGLFLLRLTPSQFYHRFIWCMQAFMVIYSTVALSKHHFSGTGHTLAGLIYCFSHYPYPMSTSDCHLGPFSEKRRMLFTTWPSCLRIF